MEYSSGYWGKILRVNLTERKIITEPLPGQEVLRMWIGGRGLGVRYFLEEVNPKIDPLGNENKIIILTGPLTATGYPTSGRCVSLTKSPLTETIHDSNFGGQFGAQLKQSGFDGLMIEGVSEEPVYLWIHDGEAEIRKAGELWGRDTRETTEMIREELGDKKISVLAIGPAGENKVRYASVMVDYSRAAGRGGHGAVFGAKKLKAIAVKGNLRVPIREKERFYDVIKNHMSIIRENYLVPLMLNEFGTAMGVNFINESGFFPVMNFKHGYHELADNLSGETIATTILTKKYACAFCPIQCARYTKIDDPEYAGQGSGPEYETLGMLGANLGIFNLKAVAKANYMANELGLDTIELGATIGLFMDLYGQGKIKKSDLKEIGEIEPRFGNEEALFKLIEAITYRKGIGNLLAEGTYRVAEKYNALDIAPTVRKQAWAAYDPRGAYGQALSYATSNRGGCHLRGYVIKREVFGIYEVVDRLDIEGKGKMVVYAQNLKAAVDSLIVCEFLTFVYELPQLADALSALTGWDISPEEFLKIGERIYNAERLFNIKSFGDGREWDSIPRKFLEQPIERGPLKGVTIKGFEKMLEDYYKERGWIDGRPTIQKLKELSLEKYQ